MRGTNYNVGFGIGLFFLLGGVAMFLLGGKLFPAGTAGQDIGGAGDTFRMIGAIWAGVSLLLLLLFGLLRFGAAKRAQIAATGFPGTATVTAVEQTGVYINHNPQFRLALDLSTGRRVDRRAVVPLTALGRFGIGTRLPIRVAAEDPDDFEIMWDELPVPGRQQAAASNSVPDRMAALDRMLRDGLINATEYQSKRQELLADL